MGIRLARYFGELAKDRRIGEYVKKGEYEAALKICDEIMEKNPSDVVLLEQRSEVLDLMGRGGDAIKCLVKAANTPSPANDQFTLHKLVEAVKKYKESQEAKAVIRDCLSGKYKLGEEELESLRTISGEPGSHSP